MSEKWGLAIEDCAVLYLPEHLHRSDALALYWHVFRFLVSETPRRPTRTWTMVLTTMTATAMLPTGGPGQRNNHNGD